MPDGHWKGRRSIKSSSVVLRRLLWTCLTLWHACLSRSSPTSHCSLAHFPNYFFFSSLTLADSLVLPSRGSRAACSTIPLYPLLSGCLGLLLVPLSSSPSQQSCCAQTCISRPAVLPNCFPLYQGASSARPSSSSIPEAENSAQLVK